MENIYIGLVGSLLVLDTTVAFQFLISQPLIACTLLGWFLGDIQLGVQVGMYLQLLWLSSMPVGAAIVPEGNLAAIVITALVIRYNNNYENFNILLICGLFYGIAVSYLGGEIVVLFRKANQYFLHKVLALARRGKLNVLNVINYLGLVFHYSLMFILIASAMYIGDYLFKYIIQLPIEWDKYFKYAVMSLIGIGAGLVLSIFKEKMYQLLIAVGLAIGCVLFVIL
ncbi:MAG: PTS sugar transporter subunit IIC [Planctomycetota bacterium]|jgi:mannose/fructose/N-acetylgalactosamine-specific phosphotransferase system component IIC